MLLINSFFLQSNPRVQAQSAGNITNIDMVLPTADSAIITTSPKGNKVI
jgi:hypothetical protein